MIYQGWGTSSMKKTAALSWTRRKRSKKVVNAAESQGAIIIPKDLIFYKDSVSLIGL